MNRLAQSSSLYLRQHADNPVDWQPWDDRALTEARDSQRPILLSIGYSACHWCHVMAHESFEDPKTARWMNDLFVNIKVDREERPDLDRVYQLSHQLLTGRGGGWPLTVFLDPHDLVPFFAGTYFPPEPRHGLPSFGDLLRKVREWYDTRGEEVAEQNRRLGEAVASLQRVGAQDAPDGPEALRALPAMLRQNYDAGHGGFGDAPKFPQAPLLSLVQFLAQGEPGDAASMLRGSLTSMAMSGLRDHLDGGFFRYTVDGAWTIPHFEKMLYDNAMLLPLYAEAATEWDDAFLAAAAEGIVAWLVHEMRHENGGFLASIDADADGREGGFHVWQRAEVEALLEPGEFEQVARLFGLDQPPNFEGRAWHLVRRDGDPPAAVPTGALRKLAHHRSLRVAPTTDPKQLTSWNALCIEGLARAGMARERPEWLDLAERSLAFVRGQLLRNGQLYAVFAQGRAQFPAYLDDHAGLLLATLALMQARWRPDYLAFATSLAETLLERFADPQGGFFFTADGAEAPIHRLRPTQDDALPAGNGVAARALLRLGHLTGEARYLAAARGALAAAGSEMGRYPLAHATLMLALGEYHHPPAQVIVTGADQQAASSLVRAASSASGGRHRLLCYEVGGADGPLPAVLGALPRPDAAAAFVCRGPQCLPAVHDPDELAKLLGEPG